MLDRRTVASSARSAFRDGRFAPKAALPRRSRELFSQCNGYSLRQELASAIALLEEAITDRFPFRSSGSALSSCHCPKDGDTRVTGEPRSGGLTPTVLRSRPLLEALPGVPRIKFRLRSAPGTWIRANALCRNEQVPNDSSACCTRVNGARIRRCCCVSCARLVVSVRSRVSR